MLMNLSLGASDLKRKSVADFYDSMYKQAVTADTIRQMQGRPTSYSQAVEGELSKIEAERQMSEKEYFDVIDKLADNERDIEQFNRELATEGDWFTDGKGNTRWVRKGTNPPPGFSERTSTPTYGEKLRMRTKESQYDDVFGPDAVTNAMSSLSDTEKARIDELLNAQLTFPPDETASDEEVESYRNAQIEYFDIITNQQANRIAAHQEVSPDNIVWVVDGPNGPGFYDISDRKNPRFLQAWTYGNVFTQE